MSTNLVCWTSAWLPFWEGRIVYRAYMRVSLQMQTIDGQLYLPFNRAGSPELVLAYRVKFPLAVLEFAGASRTTLPRKQANSRKK